MWRKGTTWQRETIVGSTDSRVHRADTFRAVLEVVSPVLPEAAAALAGGADLDALVSREMAAKRAEKEAKAKEGARG